MVERTSLKTLAEAEQRAVFTSNPKTVRVALDAEESVPEHSHPEKDIVFHVVEGALELTLDEETYEVSGGDILQFDGERTISGTAQEPTTVLVVLADRPE